jgi:hypothetical protein
MLPLDSPPQSGSSGAILHRFKTDAIDLHPAIVHIMAGSDDVDFVSDEGAQYISPSFLDAMQQMIKMAKAANIQVILGIESPQWPDEGSGYLTTLNSIVATLGLQNNIPVINYADALCACVSSTGGIGIGENFAVTGGQYMTPIPPPNLLEAYQPTPEGYALMTQMAEATIDTLGLTLQSGYLQDAEQANQANPINPVNTNVVGTEAVIQFTPYGQYNNGVVEPLINSTYAGSTGTWESSNPLVMYISQTGLATSLSQGYAVITYKSPSGVKFNEWVMEVP